MNESCTYIKNNISSIKEQLLFIASIYSPTFSERKKVRYLKACLKSYGLENVQQDKIGNLSTYVPGETNETILLCAHMDTALALKNNPVYEHGDKLYGHGVCDNTAGIVALLTLLKYLSEKKKKPYYGLKILFTVQEEGLGGKNGIKQFLKQTKTSFNAVINVESHNVGRITVSSIGQFRVQISINTKKGGHSWRDYGNKNAVVLLSELIYNASQHRNMFKNGESSFNWSLIQGGSSINAIPSNSSVYYELRTIKQTEFLLLKQKFYNEIHNFKKKHTDTELDMKVIADSEPANISEDDQLVRYTKKIHAKLKISSILNSGNTDGDVPLELHIPTVTIGTSIGSNTHSPDEYLEILSLVKGYAQVLELINNLHQLNYK